MSEGLQDIQSQKDGKLHVPFSPDREDKQFKRPVILLKGKESDQNKTDGPIQPTIILKSREADSRAISPNLQAGKPKKDGDPSPSYHLAPKTIQPESVNLTWMPPMMKKSVKLLDNSTLQMCDGLLEFLTDQTDFLVVGCLGLQGVGKSTVMSHLAAPPEILFDESTFKYKKIKMVFPSHSTEGVDAFITPDRVILLDCQPLLAMSKVPRNPSDNSRNTNREDADFSVPENDNEIESLQYAAFIFSVCHVVLIVQDWGGNPDYMRFYHTAEMLKPATPTPTEDEELVEYFPHAMIIHTKTKPPYFSREKFHELQCIGHSRPGSMCHTRRLLNKTDVDDSKD
ncbi:hypothetical protein AAG570_012242 [Ranatra chinensis]|uniref:Protein SMG9 n=1 Tax=Ranatra chinensis TaxID=642074 RepID=A0ABD0Z4J6_9HEMI